MLRRFEMYSLHPDADEQAVADMESAFLRAGRFIPELLHCGVGRNLSGAAIDIIWEHAYGSPEAYQRYMVHPYHAAVLDRFLLRDSPECIITDSELPGAGLVGYSCAGADYYMPGGVRLVTLLRVDPSASPAAVHALEDALGQAVRRGRGMTVCVVAPNTMGSRWFDGVTEITAPSRWTHIWEQGFDTLADLDAYRRSDAPEAVAGRAGWAGWMDGIVTQSAQLYYELIPGDPAGAPPT
jgi:Stress responsive A/B Barrel Domain